jgi:hypothetical protein
MFHQQRQFDTGMLDLQRQIFVSEMLQCPGVSVSVQQSSNEGPLGTNFSFLQIVIRIGRPASNYNSINPQSNITHKK